MPTYSRPAFETSDQLIVPALSILEVFKWILREHGEDLALEVAASMQQARVIDLDAALAMRAARLGWVHGLPLADSVIYATAQAHGAILWTQDTDFEGLPDVRFTAKHRV